MGGTLTLESLGFPSRTQTVPNNQRSIKASRRVRTTLIHHVTLGIEGVLMHMSPSALWDPLYGVLNMMCQGGDASRVHSSLPSLSHWNTLSTRNTCHPLHARTLERTTSVCRWRSCCWWLRNKYTATIKIHSSSFCPCLALLGGVLYASF